MKKTAAIPSLSTRRSSEVGRTARAVEAKRS